MPTVMALAVILAFMQTRSVLDLLRCFVVFFLVLRTYPFPAPSVWTLLGAYSALVLTLRTVYELPIFCHDLQWRGSHPSPKPGEPDSVMGWCPAMLRLGLDATLGMINHTGGARIFSDSWFSLVWADHLCIWAALLHKWMLLQSGLWDYVTYDRNIYT